MNPLRWLLDPVAVKELSGTARRWQTYVARGTYVSLCAFVIWSFSDQIRFAVSARYSPSAYAQLGSEIFLAFILLQSGLVLLTGASAASDLLCKEVRLGTLGVLACSPLTPWRIAFGKWKAAMMQTASLLFCGLPVLAVCVYLGGATPRVLVSSFSISFAAAALSCAVGLFCSSLFRSSATALMVSVGVIAVYTFGPVYFERDLMLEPVFAHVQLLYALKNSMGPLPPSQAGLGDAWMSACVFTLGISLALVRATASRIDELAVRTPTVPLLTRFFAALDRYYETHNPGNILLFSRGDAVWETRALLWKELQTRASGRLRNSVRISLVLLMALALTFSVELRYLNIPIWISTLLLWFLAISNGASLFVKEKEERKWDILLATPLGSGDILSAKLLAGIVPVVPALAVFALFWLTSIAINRLTPADIGVSLLSIGLPGALAYLLGAVCSLRARSLRGSFTTALSVMIGISVGIPMLCDRNHDFTRHDVAWISPVPYIEAMCGHGLQDMYWNDAGVLLLFFILIYGGASVALMVYLYSSFDQIAGRSE